MPLPTDADLRRARKTPLFNAAELPTVLDLGRGLIEKLLPHRGGFLLLDHLDRADLALARLSATRWLDPADPVFADHFPGAPVYPGVLQLEMAGQASLCLAALMHNGGPTLAPDHRPTPVRLVRIHDASFVTEAQPGDTLRVLTQSFDDGGYTYMALGQVLRGDTVISVSLFEAMILDPSTEVSP